MKRNRSGNNRMSVRGLEVDCATLAPIRLSWEVERVIRIGHVKGNGATTAAIATSTRCSSFHSLILLYWWVVEWCGLMMRYMCHFQKTFFRPTLLTGVFSFFARENAARHPRLCSRHQADFLTSVSMSMFLPHVHAHVHVPEPVQRWIVICVISNIVFLYDLLISNPCDRDPPFYFILFGTGARSKILASGSFLVCLVVCSQPGGRIYSWSCQP